MGGKEDEGMRVKGRVCDKHERGERADPRCAACWLNVLR